MKEILCLTVILLSIRCLGQSGEIGTYYFVELIPNKVPERYSKTQLDSIQQKHMLNIKTMATTGQLVLAGPFKDGGGLFILKAEDEKAAQWLVKNDPAVLAKRFTYIIREWYTEKSMFTLESN